jgi:type I restriction enzyme, S subunit
MSANLKNVEHWDEWPLNDLVLDERPICYGVLKPGPFEPNGVPLIRILDLENNAVQSDGLYRISPSLDKQFARSRLNGGEILISIQGTIGRVALVPESLRGANISRTMARAALSASVDGHFIRQWLISDLGQRRMGDAVLGTTRDSLNIAALRLIPVPLPPLPEQRRIAEVLDTADEAIRQTEALIAKLKQMKQGLLHDLLTRGLDENGELRDPVAHPEQFKDSPLGRIPRGWEVRTLAHLISDMRNGTTATQQDEPTPYPVSRIETIADGTIDFTRVKYLARPDARYQLQPGDILFSHINSVAHMGKVAYFGGERALYHGMNLMLIRPDDAQVGPRYLFEILASERARAYARRECKSAVNQASLGQGQIGGLLVTVPSADEQRRIVAAIDGQDACIRAEEAYRDKLQLLKKGLMQDLLTGRVRVPVPDGEFELAEVGA